MRGTFLDRSGAKGQKCTKVLGGSLGDRGGALKKIRLKAMYAGPRV